MSLKELQLPSIASLRAIAALKSPHLALVRPARIGLGFESAGANQKTLLEIENTLGGPGRLSLPYSLRLLLDVLTGVGVLHRTLSFVHGEVQPEHVVLGEDGVGRLIPVVRAHWVRGEERAPERLYYLAPEKLLGDRVDVRSDVFSVGVMLWEALAGQRLLEAHDVDDIIARLMGGGIPRPQTPEAEAWTAPLASIAERAIAVDPGRRFATVAEMKDALQAACSRYLASPPGMAEVFQNPERRARNHVRESSIAPESQRVTVPPGLHPYTAGPADVTVVKSADDVTRVRSVDDVTVVKAISETTLEAAPERLSRSSYASIDMEDEQTTVPQAAPEPVVTRGKHVNTLLGVALPFVDRESAPPEEPTLPFARIPPSTPVVITPLPIRAPGPPQSRMRTPVAWPAPPPASAYPPASAPVPASAPASAPAPISAHMPAESRRAVSLSPLVAAPVAPMITTAVEPSFELLRPRKRRGALWLILGAAIAIGLFAARPWLARQVAAATGAMPDNAVTNVDAPPTPVTAPLPSAAPSIAPPVVSSAPAVGIASTPPVPSEQAKGRARTGTREKHVVIHDSVEPNVSEPAAPAPVEPKPAPVAAPPAPPPSPAPKAKPTPVSDADQYGI